MRSVFVGLSLALLTALSACSGGPDAQVIIQSEQAGEGPLARAGDRVAVHYRGWLYDPARPGNKGRAFDSSYERGRPFSFVLGAGQVIDGWDQGVAGMREGGRRTLVIPPELGYGGAGAGAAIPPDATLVFEVELIDVLGG